MSTRIQVACRSWFHSWLTPLSGVRRRTNARIVTSPWMISANTFVQTRGWKTVILIMCASSSVVSRWTDTLKSRSQVDTSCTIHANRTRGFTLVDIQWTRRPCETGQTIAPVSIDEVRTGSIVKAWIRPAVINVDLTSRSFGSGRAETFVSLCIAIQRLVMKLGSLFMTVVVPQEVIVVLRMWSGSIGCIQVDTSASEHTRRWKAVIDFLVAQLAGVSNRTLAFKSVYAINTCSMDAGIICALVDICFAWNSIEKSELNKVVNQNMLLQERNYFKGMRGFSCERLKLKMPPILPAGRQSIVWRHYNTGRQ